MGQGQSTDSATNPTPLTRQQLKEYREQHRGRITEFLEELDQQFARACKKITILFAKKQREECELDQWVVLYDDLVDEEDLSLIPLCQGEVANYGQRIKENLENTLPDYHVEPAMNEEGDLVVSFTLRPSATSVASAASEESSSTST
jgi:hypothetical protein